MESGMVDGSELLEWLQSGVGDERDLQMMALEQLCMTLLMSDNIDRCFESCPPRTFLPALGRIFVDETAPENILEVTARAITYYLDVSNECTRRITQVDGAIKAICNRLIIAEMEDRTSKDLAEQCVKLLEHICQREASAVFDAGGLQAMLHLISHYNHLHTDTMHSAMAVVTKLCAKMEPNDPNLPECSKNLGELLSHDDEKIAECALRCFAAMTDRFIRRQMDPVELARPSNLVAHLFNFLIPSNFSDNSLDQSAAEIQLKRNTAFISAVFSLFANLCKGSPTVTTEILHSIKLVHALKMVLNSKDERSINDSLRFIDLLLVLLCEGRTSISKHSAFGTDPNSSQIFDKAHKCLIDSIRQRDTDALIEAVENATVDPNYVDDVGQTLLNWCSAFGTTDMVIYLCDKGACPNKGTRSSSLHYAACFGRAEIVKILLRYGANPDLQDEEGRTALDKARERNDEAHQQVCSILQNPGAYMSSISSNLAKKQQSTQESASKLNEKEKIDYELAEKFIQQLLPEFCTIFKNSLSSGIRRITLSLIRKCIFHISNEGLFKIIHSKCGGGANEPEKITGAGGFVELLIGVLIIILESGDNNIDAKEQALMIIKSLLLKDSKFWSEQLIRLGVYEKIESLANTSTASTANISNTNDGLPTESIASPAENILSNYEEEKKENSADKLAIGTSYDRSSTSTPSISLRSDSTAQSNDFSAATEPVLIDITPSPTLEIVQPQRQSNSAPIEDDNQTLDEHSQANSPAFDSDLVEAATSIAQALGVQIVEDAATKSDEQNAAGSDDVWAFEANVFYRWKDWRLIRSKDSLFIWCDAIALELSDGSNGWLRFLMNGRLSTMYSSGSPEYGADNPESRAEFIEKIQKAKAAIPTGAPIKSILSIPRQNSKLESGNWQIASTEANTMSITNREGTQQKLCIKDDLPGFIFESSRQHKQLFTAETTLGHDFVTGWAARGGGVRLRYFRTEMQKQKIGDLAKEIWECYLKESCGPREAVLEIQKCSEKLECVSKAIIDVENGQNLSQLPIHVEELTNILTKIRDALCDDRFLSIFEISISGLVPSLLQFVQLIETNTNGILAETFAKIFADPNHLTSLVRKIILVLESIEKFPQYLYDSPGGSPFGFQLLTRRLRFRFEQAANSATGPQEQSSKAKEDKGIVDITNRSLKTEPLVTVAALKAHIYEHITNPKNAPSNQAGPSSSSTLANLHYTRPPTAASIRMARKLPKMSAEKMNSSSGGGAGTSSSITEPHKKTPQIGGAETLLSARSAYMAAGCLEKVGGNIKVKQAGGSGGKYPSGSKQTARKSTSKASKTLSSSSSSRGGPSQQRNVHQKDHVEKPANESGGGNMGGQQQQKSMSTTNLFDADYKKSRGSTSGFNQAASAESLQHQTPSLEKLLSKARLHDYSIPEESMATPNSGSPEPKNLTTFEPSRFEKKRKGSENAQTLSIGASTFSGGSQPVLNSSSFSRERFQTVDSSTEKLEEQIESSAETMNESMQKEVSDLLQFMDAGPFMVDDDFGGQNQPPNENVVQQPNEFPEMHIQIMENPTIQTASQNVFDNPTSMEGTSSSSNAAENSGKKATMAAADVNIKVDKAGPSTSKADQPTSSGTGTSSELQQIGSNIRGKLGSYAEILKHMMNQVFESGDDIYDADEYDNEIYEDEVLSQYFIEQECDPHIIDGNGFSLSSDSSSISGFVEPQHGHPSSTISTNSNIMNEAAGAFETFTQAAGNSRAAAVAAIRAAMEKKDNIFSSIHSHPIEVMLGAHSDQRQRLRQMLAEEFGATPPMNNNDKIHHRGGCGEGCARAIRMAISKDQAGGWNDDFVIRQQFGALIPAFDPRPGRTNVNQTQEVELTEDVQFNNYQRKGSILVDISTNEKKDSGKNEAAQNIRIYLKKSKKPTNLASEESDSIIELKDADASLFYYVQKLLLLNQPNLNSTAQSTNPSQISISPFSDINGQIWDQTFTLVYDFNNTEGAEKIATKEEQNSNEEPIKSNHLVEQSLDLIRILNKLNENKNGGKCLMPTIPADVFYSSKITQKLSQELTDPLVVAARTLPNWCNQLVYSFPCLFSLDTRVMYLNTTAFGTSRAIGYLQGKRDQLLEQNRSTTTSAENNMAGLRREDHYPEYRIGRVKHERIKVHRNEDLFLESALKVLKFHAMRKSMLEIEYYGEEGTGLGPTLEFFALISSEFQRKDLCMWICDDLKGNLLEEQMEYSNMHSKHPNYYVHSKQGLFPAPWPENSSEFDKTLELFQIFGVFLAKAIQDDRLVDLPLSPAFLKLILSNEFATGPDPSIKSILGIDDLVEIYPEKAKMLKCLINFVDQRKLIESNDEMDNDEKSKQLKNLKIRYLDGSECTFEDLALSFAVNPPSTIFPYISAELIENGCMKEVTAQNVELYIEKCIDLYLNTGIQEQMFAFRSGFDMVFPLASLVSFSPSEFQTILSGEQYPKWSRDDLLRYTEPKLGYTRDSPGFLNFVEVLYNFNPSERKAFLQFTTGCSSLPPGGLANLHPRLTIVRKVGSGDGSYPSVNTCVHYLKLPEYSNADILRERLLAATFEKGFHLN